MGGRTPSWSAEVSAESAIIFSLSFHLSHAECDKSCDKSCDGPGPGDCDACREGYKQSEADICVKASLYNCIYLYLCARYCHFCADIDECKIDGDTRCKEDTYCFNSFTCNGAFNCVCYCVYPLPIFVSSLFRLRQCLYEGLQWPRAF